ncbi:MAG: hypothetical protein Q8Q23_06140 [bacterium]|nr:hypothetical protein [bacterium]
MENSIFQKISFFAVLGLILIIIIYLSVNAASYFDPLSWCHIKIHGDIAGGSEKTIKQALRTIKKTNPGAYAEVCNYVDTISEKRYCQTGDSRVESGLEGGGWIDPPCYVKGSKTIYLLSDKEESEAVVSKRAAQIVEFARRSQTFWQPIDLFMK